MRASDTDLPEMLTHNIGSALWICSEWVPTRDQRAASRSSLSCSPTRPNPTPRAEGQNWSPHRDVAINRLRARGGGRASSYPMARAVRSGSFMASWLRFRKKQSSSTWDCRSRHCATPIPRGAAACTHVSFCASDAWLCAWDCTGHARSSWSRAEARSRASPVQMGGLTRKLSATRHRAEEM